MAITRHWLRIRMLDALGDQRPRAWAGRPTYSEYVKDPQFKLVAQACHTMFGAKCWVCGLTAKAAKGLNKTFEPGYGNHLTTAHILYPPEPFEEIVDTDLSRSDVVLLCWLDHQAFDARTDTSLCENLDDLRDLSIRTLRQLKLLRRVESDDAD